MELLTDYHIWISFFTLASLEIILGIDNIVFIALLVSDLPEKVQAKARTIGLLLALVMRIGLLFALAWVMTLTEPLFALFDHEVSGKDLMMLIGGGFLLYKGTDSIHDEVMDETSAGAVSKPASFMSAIVQIVLIDMVFSFDSVVTAVGLTPHIPVIIAAMVVAMAVMIAAAEYVSTFLERFPTLKMLALSFIMLIGIFLVADGLGLHIPKGYIYFAMAFSLCVEVLNLKVRRKRRRKKLKA